MYEELSVCYSTQHNAGYYCVISGQLLIGQWLEPNKQNEWVDLNKQSNTVYPSISMSQARSLKSFLAVSEIFKPVRPPYCSSLLYCGVKNNNESHTDQRWPRVHALFLWKYFPLKPWTQEGWDIKTSIDLSMSKWTHKLFSFVYKTTFLIPYIV